MLKKGDKVNQSTARVTIPALPKTRHLPVHAFLPSATEYTKALELNERWESSPQPREAIFEEFSPSFLNLLACWSAGVKILPIDFDNNWKIFPFTYFVSLNSTFMRGHSCTSSKVTCNLAIALTI